jgi:DNA-binding GntR family transcriptional regulator
MIIALHDYVKYFAEIPCYLPGRLRSGWEEHKEIVDAIDDGDDERAESAARNHIMLAKKSLLNAILNDQENINEKIKTGLGLQQ